MDFLMEALIMRYSLSLPNNLAQLYTIQQTGSVGRVWNAHDCLHGCRDAFGHQEISLLQCNLFISCVILQQVAVINISAQHLESILTRFEPFQIAVYSCHVTGWSWAGKHATGSWVELCLLLCWEFSQVQSKTHWICLLFCCWALIHNLFFIFFYI